MELFRLYGFQVQPQRTVPAEAFVKPGGGPITSTPELEAALAASLAAARSMTSVDLRIDTRPEVRSSPVRDSVMSTAFGAADAAQASSSELARRLSESMDDRSKPCLFLVAAYRPMAASPLRRVALWIFPQEEAFRLTALTVELLNDIFSRTSALRKLALFEGHEIRSAFTTAQVLDFQAGAGDEVARFWIERFLDAQLSISDEGGTRLLAQTIARVSEQALSAEEREQLQAAAIAVRTMPAPRWSLQSFATQMLGDDLRGRFLEEAPNDATVSSMFGLDRDVFEASLRTRIFRLESGVLVYSPLGEVGQSVRIETEEDVSPPRVAPGNAQGERLSVEGTVVEDKLSRRSG